MSCRSSVWLSITETVPGASIMVAGFSVVLTVTVSKNCGGPEPGSGSAADWVAGGSAGDGDGVAAVCASTGDDEQRRQQAMTEEQPGTTSEGATIHRTYSSCTS